MAITAQELLASINAAGIDTVAKADAAFKALAAQREVTRLTAVVGRLEAQLAETRAQLRAASAARDGDLGRNGG